MAEFVSAIVGLIAVGAHTSNSLYTLIHTFKDAPNEIQTLSDEVNDFQAMLSNLSEVNSLEEWTSEKKDKANTHMDGVVNNGRQAMQNIEALIANVRKERLEKEGKTQVNRIKWMRMVKRAKKLQDQLRAQKAIICSFITLSTLKCSARHGLLVTRLEMKMDMVIKNQLSLMEKQSDTAKENGATRGKDDGIEKAGATLPSVECQQTLTSEWLAAPPSGNTTFPLSLSTQTSTTYRRSNALKANKTELFYSPKMSTETSLSCLEDCRCRCHFRSVVRSPRLLSKFLGDVILGFSNLPWAVSGFLECDEQTCRRKRSSETDVKYILPSWFGNAVANFQVDFAVRFLPLNVRVRTLNTIPYDSPILVCTQEGNLEGIMRLLQSGVASLYDVDPYGLGLLYYASYYCWRSSGKESAVRTCRFLLDIGADADMEDERGSTPLDTLIGDTLISLASESRGSRLPESSDFEHITQLFGKSTRELVADFVTASNFATIHRVLLGIQEDYKTLEDFLGKSESALHSTGEIDIPDSTGRSALAWAVEYGWADATKTLLKYGANPHQMVRSPGIVSPLLHLAIAMPVSAGADNGSLHVVRELLRAGANINAVDHENWTPLHVAASWNNYDIIRELATFGGDTLDWDMLTNDNQSAVDLSLNEGVNDKVQAILKHRQVERGHIVGTAICSEDKKHELEDDVVLGSEDDQFFDSEEV